MLRHLFKLIWNKKKAHSLLMVEIWASFMVLFGVLSLIVYNVRNYVEPIGFDYEDRWILNLSNNQDTLAVGDKVASIYQRLNQYAEVEEVTRTGSNTPFSMNTMNNSVSYKDAKVLTNFYPVDENYAQTMNLPVTAGRWFNKADAVSKHEAIVINDAAREKLFGAENPIGKLVKRDDKLYWRVVGIVDNFKAKGEFMSDEPGLFTFIKDKNAWEKEFILKVKPGTDANFEAKLVKDIAGMVKDWNVEVTYMTDSRKNQHSLTLVPVVIFLVICSFLLVNVALGLFGILNLNIAKRRDEIGLRRAMGATEKAVTRQFLGEIWVLATISMLLGLLFAVQFPLLNVFDIEGGIYLVAMALAMGVVYLIVTLCAWYPSQQASRIHPAVALHEE
ncbi:ABC transporter permease [Telluribacter sp. SYSU D00476]|uniref:ABC transporter permease n=1 Tax=Telluribacter sp. SYSU D00476 TaxID=2811430 RepID=UPI001FF5B034|nr:ABC transporter permease [Telluribacter sp. SYSU D00476]